MLLELTQLAGVPVKVSPHRSLNTSRGVIRPRDIADCNVEEIVEELQPQGVTAASIIHVRDGDSRLLEGPCGAIHPEPSALLQLPKVRP